MKNQRLAFTGFIFWTSLFISACDNNLDINGKYIEKKVVWGLLDAGLDTNYLRINKSFLDESSSAYYLASDPDNLYYGKEDLEVYLEEWKFGAFRKRLEVQYVDGDSLGIVKEEGVFAASPNILYRVLASLDTFATYKLFIVDNATQDTIRSETNLVHSFSAFYPTKTGSHIDFTDTSKITYMCHSAVNGKLYELWMHFNYLEINIASGDSTMKTIKWQIFENIEADNINGSGIISFSLNRSSFFNFLSGEIDPDPDVNRIFSSMDFYWYAGGIEIYDQYLNILANLGINEEYISPEYTNIEGGLGLFSSRYILIVPDVLLANETIDTIACGDITSGLRFFSSPASLYYPGCE